MTYPIPGKKWSAIKICLWLANSEFVYAKKCVVHFIRLGNNMPPAHYIPNENANHFSWQLSKKLHGDLIKKMSDSSSPCWDSLVPHEVVKIDYMCAKIDKLRTLIGDMKCFLSILFSGERERGLNFSKLK